MTNTALWHFIATHGLQTREVVTLMAGIIFLAIFPWLVSDTRNIPRNQITYGNIVGTLSFLIIGLFCLLFVWILLRQRYLLQPGLGRYTVATVYKRDTWRGRPRFASQYYVAGRRWQTGQSCGLGGEQDLACPSIGTRQFVYFALEDPGTSQILVAPVPDTLRTIPPLGWARLP